VLQLPAHSRTANASMGKPGDVKPSALEQCVLMICEVVQAFDLGYVEPLEMAMDILARAAGIKVDSISKLRAVPKAPAPAAPKKDKDVASTYSS